MQRVSVNGVELQVMDQGAGIPVVFVHGFPLSHAMWHEQISGLADVCRSIAPDLRGFGGSQLGNLPDETITMEQLADDLAALLDALQVTEPVVLCGLSMGGCAVWQFVRKYRQKLRGLILCDTRAMADAPEAVANRHRLAQLVIEKGPEVISTAMLPNLFASVSSERQQAVITQMRDVIHATSPQTIAAGLRGLAARPDVRCWLPDVDLPALLIVGVDDKISTVAEMRDMANSLPNARLVVVPEAGHMAPLENPIVVNAAIKEFLAEL